MYDVLWKSKCDLGYRCASSIGKVRIKSWSQFSFVYLAVLAFVRVVLNLDKQTPT